MRALRGDVRGPGKEMRATRWGGAAVRQGRPQRKTRPRRESYPFVSGANRSIQNYVSVYSPASGPQVADDVQNGKFQLTQEL